MYFQTKDDNKIIVNVLLFVIYLIALLPLTQIGFTTSDDMDNFLLSENISSPFLYGYSLSFKLSRFYNIFTGWVYFIPYLIDSKLYFDIIFILPFVACFILFVNLIKKIFNNYSLTLLSALFLAANFQIAAYHSITSAYPFYFTFPFCLSIISIHIMLSYYKNRRFYLLIISSIILFFSSMFYESFLSYFVIPIIVSISKNNFFNEINKNKIKIILKELSPFLCLLIFYLIVYIIYRENHPIKYWGSKFPGDFNVFIALKSATQLGFYSIPLNVFCDLKNIFTTYSMDFNNEFSLFKIGIVSYIQGILVSLLVFYSLMKYKKINNKTLILSFFLGILTYYLPLLPLSVSSKYFDQNLYNYVPTFFASFGVCISFISLIFLLLNLLGRYKFYRFIYIFSITLSMFFLTLLTNYSNNIVAKDLEYSNYRLQLTEGVFKSNISNKFINDPICMEEAHNTSSIMGKWITGQLFTWEKYIDKTTLKKVNVYEKYENFYQNFHDKDSVVWVAYFRQAQKTKDALMFFVKTKGELLTKNQKDITADTIIVYYLSPYKKFNVSFATKNISDTYINDVKLNNTETYYSTNITFNNRDEISCFEISGEQIIISSLNINNILNYGEEINLIY